MSGNWSFLQWKFTACRYNIENANGFNTFSMSEGLSREDKEDLIRAAGAYAPPDHLPYQPSREEIRALFPVVFSSFPLRSGKMAVVRTVYVGKDYAGVRWGNFFSHGLILREEHWPFHPIRLWNSPLFADGLTETELSLTGTPPPLPSLEVGEEDLHDFSAEIPSFLARDADRESALVPLVNCVRDGQTSGKPVLLRDEPENVPYWIAAVQYVFPPKLAGAVTFTTYAKSQPTSRKFHLFATSLEGNEFKFGSASLDATNHLFDFPQGARPDSPPGTTLFTGCIKTDEVPYPGQDLQEIRQFAEGIECRLADDSLDKAVPLYKFLQWDMVPEDRRTLKVILDFYGSQPLKIRQRQTFQILSKEHVYDTETLGLLLPILIKTLEESKMHPKMVKPFYVFFVKQFETEIEDLSPTGSRDRLALIDETVANHRDLFLERLPDGDSLFDFIVRNVCSEDGGKYASLYLALILCLYAERESEFQYAFQFMPRLEGAEFDRFSEAMLEFAVRKALSPAVHDAVVRKHMDREPGQVLTYGFAGRYADELCKYGPDQWSHGRDAGEQAASFMGYLVKSSPETWINWTHSNIKRIFYLKDNDDAAKKKTFESIMSQLSKMGIPVDEARKNALQKDLIGYRTFKEKVDEQIEQCGTAARDFISRFWVGLAVLFLFLASLLFFYFFGSELTKRLVFFNGRRTGTESQSMPDAVRPPDDQNTPSDTPGEN